MFIVYHLQRSASQRAGFEFDEIWHRVLRLCVYAVLKIEKLAAFRCRIAVDAVRNERVLTNKNNKIVLNLSNPAFGPSIELVVEIKLNTQTTNVRMQTTNDNPSCLVCFCNLPSATRANNIQPVPIIQYQSSFRYLSWNEIRTSFARRCVLSKLNNWNQTRSKKKRKEKTQLARVPFRTKIDTSTQLTNTYNQNERNKDNIHLFIFFEPSRNQFAWCRAL